MEKENIVAEGTLEQLSPDNFEKTPEATFPTPEVVAMTVSEGIDALVAIIGESEKSRENSLAITNLQQAKHWYLAGKGLV